MEPLGAEVHGDRSSSLPGNAFRLFLDGAAASCIAETSSLPLEVIKMRLQLQREERLAPGVPAGKHRYTGMLNAMSTIVKQERWYSLWKGLEAGLQKQIMYTGLRLGLYEHLTGAHEDTSMPAKIAYAALTTGIGILVANPADVVQTRFIAYRAKGPEELAARAASCATTCASAETRSAVRPSTAVPTAPTSALQLTSPPQVQLCTSSNTKRSLATYATAVSHKDCGSHTNGVSRHIFHHHWRHIRSSAGSAAPGSIRTGGAGPLRAPLQPLATPTACPCAVDAMPRGPRTVTGVPLQNARMAYYILIREEGLVNGLYRGFWANFACNCMQGAAEIATYDVAKTTALSAGYPDSMPVHLTAGITAGCVATLLSNPLDVVSTRLMAAKRVRSLDMPVSTFGTITKIWRNEGLGAFYKGFGPNVLRIGAFNIVLWLSYEQIRKLGR